MNRQKRDLWIYTGVDNITSGYDAEELNKHIDLLKEALSKDENLNKGAEINFELGRCCEKLNRFEEALAYYNVCIRYGEHEAYACDGLSSFMPKLSIARIHAKISNSYEAAKYYTEAVLDGNNIDRVGYKEAMSFLDEHGMPDIGMELAGYIERGLQNNILSSFKELQKAYIDYPNEVHIETTGRCNARCSFCPHEELDRKNAEMADELFFKIVNDLKGIPKKFYISPFKVNEPLMDKRIFDKIHLINKELPNAHIRFFSNLNTANDDIISKIMGIGNLASIWVSLNSLDTEEYNKMMNLKLQKTVNNVMQLLESCAAAGRRPRITLGRVGDGSQADKIFTEDVDRIFGKYRELYDVTVLHRGEWIDYLDYSEDNNKLKEYPCLRWFELSITCMGKVSLCCMDGRCSFPLGDANERNVLDIYNDSSYREMRVKGYKRKYIDPCSRCSYD